MNRLASATLRQSSRCFRDRISRNKNNHPKHGQWTKKSTIASPNNPNQNVASINASNNRTYREVEKIAESVGVRLTPNELQLLKQKLTGNGFNTLANNYQQTIEQVGNRALQERTTREVCLSVVCNNANPLDKWGVRIINFFDYAGTALFAVVGTLVAGDHGMNIIGCGLVGCVAALGGGSLNAMLYGGASPLLGQPGVRWVANPSYLAVALAASIATFFTWPFYCQYQAEHYLNNVIGEDRLNKDGNVEKDVFRHAYNTNEDFRHSIQKALPKVYARILQLQETGLVEQGSVFFDHIDSDGSGDLDLEELKHLIQHRFYNGWETYTLDTLGLSSLSIAAVVLAIRLGLSPFIAATSGVTVCFGGILRDLLCGRNIALGSQSYAGATGLSSLTYVLLRELAIRRILILPMGLRAVLSAGACCAVRGFEYQAGVPLLTPMHQKKER